MTDRLKKLGQKEMPLLMSVQETGEQHGLLSSVSYDRIHNGLACD